MLNKKCITIISICLMISLAIIGCSGDDNNVPKTYSIGTEVIEGEGSIELDPDKSNYEDGETVEIKAVPEENWEFKKWTTGLSGSENPESIVVDGDLTIGARFESETGELNINIDGEGSIDIEPEKDRYNIGDEITITAIPDEGWEFKSWSGDIDSTDNPVNATIKGEEIDVSTVAESLNITANFERKRFSVTTNIEGQGSIELIPHQDKYEEGKQVEIKAIPEQGYIFDSWTGNLDGDNSPQTITVDDNLTIGAKFVEKTGIDIILEDGPERVENLSGSSTDDGIQLIWNEVEEAKGYLIYRSESTTGEKERITNIMITEAEYVDLTVEESVTYYYWVVAYCDNNLSSGMSDHFSITFE